MTGGGNDARAAVLACVLFFGGPPFLMAAAVAIRMAGMVDGRVSVTERVLAHLPLVESAADAERVDLSLVLAVVSAESGGRADARSGAGAVGLMQLLPTTATELTDRAGEPEPDLLDAATSLRLGTRYLREQLDRFAGSPCARDLAVAAYNAGPTRVRGWLKREPLAAGRRELGNWVPYTETRRYVRRVREWERRYRRLLEARRARTVEAE